MTDDRPLRLAADADGTPAGPATDEPAATGRALVPVPRPGRDVGADDHRLGDVDRWGRSQAMRNLAHRIYEPTYRWWHRVAWEGLEHIPAQGGALLVSNHAGAIPPDAPAIMHGIETTLGRPVYGLADFFFREVPVVSTLWARLGGVTAQPDNGYRLLREDGQLVLVFPEGTKATSKRFQQRYQLARFGRGGFIELAMRAGVPIIPVATVGAEEAMPVLFNVQPLARLLRVPYAPVTANMAVFGPLGLAIPFPAKFRIRVLPPIHFEVEPGLARYPRHRVMEAADEVRNQIQGALHEMLAERRSVWRG